MSNIKLTKYEKTRIIGLRAQQLAFDAIPSIECGSMINPLDIATKELEMGVVPLTLVRSFPDGSKKDINLSKPKTLLSKLPKLLKPKTIGVQESCQKKRRITNR